MTRVAQLISEGHGAGDLLEVDSWQLLEDEPGLLVVRAHLPTNLRNPQGQLFGGFTPTYVDMVSILTVSAGDPTRFDPDASRPWQTTINMRCDYFEPIVDDEFVIRGEVVNRRGLTTLVSTKFMQGDTLAAHALTTLRELPGVNRT